MSAGASTPATQASKQEHQARESRSRSILLESVGKGLLSFGLPGPWNDVAVTPPSTLRQSILSRHLVC